MLQGHWDRNDSGKGGVAPESAENFNTLLAKTETKQGDGGPYQSCTKGFHDEISQVPPVLAAAVHWQDVPSGRLRWLPLKRCYSDE